MNYRSAKVQGVKLKNFTFLLFTMLDSSIVLNPHCVIFADNFTIGYIRGNVDIQAEAA